MPAQADPELALRLAKATLDVYSQATESLLAAVARRLGRGIDQPGWAERKLSEMVALRNEAQRVLDRLHVLGPDATTDAINTAYGIGRDAADADLADVPELRTAFTGANTRSVDALIQETVTAVESTHGQILRSTMDAYRNVISEAAVPGVVSGGQTTRQAAQSALDRFANTGITGFRDSAGRNWQLDSYVEMATRTGAGRAQVAGTLDRLDESGRDLVIVSNAPQECSVCRPWEGKVLSITGATQGYPTVARARGEGLLHANCRHNLTAFIEGLTAAPTHTADPGGDAARQEQRRLERGVRQWKRREAVALDDNAARIARGHVQQWQGRLKTHVEDNDLKRLRYREQLHGPVTPDGWKPPKNAPKPRPPVVRTPKTTPTTKARAAISTMPVANRSDVGRGVSHALDNIEKVHTIPAGTIKVPVRSSDTKGEYGSFAFSLSRHEPVRININRTGDHKASTFTHEFGHYLDHQMGDKGWLTKSNDPTIAAWKAAIDASPSTQKLRNGRIMGEPRFNKDIDYYLLTNEQWARSYAQWVALRSGDAGMLGEMNKIRRSRGPRALSQWPDDEFEPIARSLDAVFKARGLLP